MRKKKTDKQKEEVVKNPEVKIEENNNDKFMHEAKEDTSGNADLPKHIDHILRLYPHYKECWISKEGFVYPKNAPKYQRKNATLYKNKYFNS